MLDPHFLDMVNGDYHLSDDSPAIDAGCDHDEAPVSDLDGDGRPQGEGYDMGADEYQQEQTTEFVVHLPAVMKQ